MTPIINPMWFYWIDVLGNIKTWIEIMAFIFFVPIIFLMVKTLPEYFENKNSYRGISEESEKEYKMFFKITKRVITGVAILFLLSIAIPKEETFYKMMVAKYATSDNIDVVLEKITEGVDYIFDKIDESGE